MSDIRIDKDPANLTMTVTADYDVPVERAWQLWSDPRQLERWWGPPTYPATFTDHDLVAGGRMAYFMTGPDGSKHHGWWEVLEVDAPTQLVVRDGFGDKDGNPTDALPTTVMTVRLDARGGGTVMTMTSRFPSTEAMEQMVAMGMEEGLLAAMGQIDDVLGAAAA